MQVLPATISIPRSRSPSSKQSLTDVRSAAAAVDDDAPRPDLKRSVVRTATDVAFDVCRAVRLAEKRSDAQTAAMRQRAQNRRLLMELRELPVNFCDAIEELPVLPLNSPLQRMGNAIDSKLQQLKNTNQLESHSISYILTPSLLSNVTSRAEGDETPPPSQLPSLCLRILESQTVDKSLSAPVHCIKCGGDELWPARATPDGSGIEFHSLETVRYRSLSEPYRNAIRLAQQDHAQRLQHCRRLLQLELPTALNKSTEAMQESLSQLAQGESEMQLSHVGAIAFEQERIRQELMAQQAKLNELMRFPPLPPEPPTYEQHEAYNCLTLYFGDNLVDGVIYRLQRNQPTEPLQVTLVDSVVQH